MRQRRQRLERSRSEAITGAKFIGDVAVHRHFG
jgi:hypothetical protein